jgi:hypothetical protein
VHPNTRFLVERIVTLNAIGCPPLSYDFHFAGPLPTTTDGQDSVLPHAKIAYGDARRFHSCGLWPLAARINHSCCSNTAHSVIGDVLVLRATRDLPAGAELTLAYRPTDGSAAGQAALDADLHRRWAFTCTCPLSAAMRATPPALQAKRDALTRDILAVLGARENSPDRMDAVDDMTSALAATYAPTDAGNGSSTNASLGGGVTAATAAAAAPTADVAARSPNPSDAPQPPLAQVQTALAVAWLDLTLWSRTGQKQLKGVFGGMVMTAALDALRARGFVMHGRIIEREEEGEAEAGEAAAPAAHEPWLVVDEWGHFGDGIVFDLWFALARVVKLLNLTAELLNAVTVQAGTAYSMLVGNDATFDEVWPRLMA